TDVTLISSHDWLCAQSSRERKPLGRAPSPFPLVSRGQAVVRSLVSQGVWPWPTPKSISSAVVWISRYCIALSDAAGSRRRPRDDRPWMAPRLSAGARETLGRAGRRRRG